jgi:transposase
MMLKLYVYGYLNRVQSSRRLEVEAQRNIELMRTRRSTVGHPFGTIKSWMGSMHFLTRTIPKVSTEMSLQVLAYNMKRAINLVGTRKIMEAIGP